jgi:glycerol-3-phosphate acyltransferase PlsY
VRLVWLVMAFGFKVSSLAALVATLVSPIAAYFLMPHGSWVVATMIIALLVLYRHQSNIKNLLGGKEGKIGSKSRIIPIRKNQKATRLR